jgi:hypothetical protein
MTVEIKKAERKQLKLRLAIKGPSGSGKTFSALAIASGLGKKILVIDTENDSALTYADEFVFDHISIKPPYGIEKYLEAIDAGIKGRYDVIVNDSISHAWSGEGGLLEQKSKLDTLNPRSNQFTNWAPISALHEKFKAFLLHSPTHMISTMRSKQEYVIVEEIRNGKTIKVPQKMGMAPVQRDDMEYEFSVVLDMDIHHVATVDKTRIKFLDKKQFTPSREVGEQLLEWLNTGAPADMTAFAPGIDPAVKIKLDAVKDLLMKSAQGDADRVQSVLTLITEHKVGTQTEFVKFEDLEFLAATKPVWIDTILNKLQKGQSDAQTN